MIKNLEKVESDLASVAHFWKMVLPTLPPTASVRPCLFLSPPFYVHGRMRRTSKKKTVAIYTAICTITYFLSNIFWEAPDLLDLDQILLEPFSNDSLSLSIVVLWDLSPHNWSNIIIPTAEGDENSLAPHVCSPGRSHLGPQWKACGVTVQREPTGGEFFADRS